MKIIHTSDWHIGKRLYHRDTEEIHEQFFAWLLNLIKEEDAEVLLVSGDIFDIAYPSNSSLRIYYKFLNQLLNTTCRHVIITGGNHDSVSTLEAPGEILKYLNVHIVGGANRKPEDLIFPVYENAEPALYVCAVPYLRDRDVRKLVPGETYEERAKAIRDGIIKYYSQIADTLNTAYNAHLPVIAMGHLFMSGASTSESEREIHIGNLAEVNYRNLPEIFDYWALGHIHRPQKPGGSERVRYSGSPIPLSFSEKNDQKQVVVLDITDAEIKEIKPVPIPAFRKLEYISGSFEEVEHAIKSYGNSPPVWADAEIIENKYNPEIIRQFEKLIQEVSNPEILNYKIRFTDITEGADEIYQDSKSLNEMSAKEVFKKRIENDVADSQQETLIKTFEELTSNLDDIITNVE